MSQPSLTANQPNILPVSLRSNSMTSIHCLPIPAKHLVILHEPNHPSANQPSILPEPLTSNWMSALCAYKHPTRTSEVKLNVCSMCLQASYQNHWSQIECLLSVLTSNLPEPLQSNWMSALYDYKQPTRTTSVKLNVCSMCLQATYHKVNMAHGQVLWACCTFI